jgi:hypothetical protein
MHFGVGQAMLLQDELAQALGFIRITLAQAVGKQAASRFAL